MATNRGRRSKGLTPAEISAKYGWDKPDAFPPPKPYEEPPQDFRLSDSLDGKEWTELELSAHAFSIIRRAKELSRENPDRLYKLEHLTMGEVLIILQRGYSIWQNGRNPTL